MTSYIERANRMVDSLANGAISPEDYTRWEKDHTEAWHRALKIRARYRPPWLGVDIKPRCASKTRSPLALKYASAGMRMETKTVLTPVASAGDQEFIVYALTFGGPPDRGGDIILPGAVANLDELIEEGVVLGFHDQNKLAIAWIKSAVQDKVGLRLVGHFHATRAAQDARTVIRERIRSKRKASASIGYTVNPGGERFERIDGQTVRFLNSINVYECSLVNVPMNRRAEFVSA